MCFLNIHACLRLCDPATDWARELIIPVRFSAETHKAIEIGVLTRKARVEINSSLATLMMVYTIRPTPDDMHTVCRRLVQKYPTLKDNSPSGYVSTLITFMTDICVCTSIFPPLHI